MAYITIQDLDINKDYTAREIDLMTFKAILAKVQTFNNVLKGNVEYIKLTLEEAIHNFSNVVISDIQPENQPVGHFWYDTSN